MARKRIEKKGAFPGVGGFARISMLRFRIGNNVPSYAR
jgi:hypothetical protein